MEASVPIRAVGDHFDVPLSTLHYWERRGLIEPHRRANRRYYDVDQLYRIALIKLWQSTGTMSLDEITTLLGAHSGDDWRATVNDRIAAIDRHLAELETARAYLAHLLGCSSEQGLERCGGFRRSVTLPPGADGQC